MTAEEVYEQALKWANVYDKKLYNLLTEDKEYTILLGDSGTLKEENTSRRERIITFTFIYYYYIFITD